MAPFKMERLGVIMEPKGGEANEVEGVLNPAAVRGPDGHLYLFPRLVAKGNYSRIGIARVVFDDAGDPRSVERLGIALEPHAEYELRPNGGGGCEDPRVVYLEPVGHYVMTYVGFGANGPRVALARSNDLIAWERIGLARFHPYEEISFDDVDDKDSCLFPTFTSDPNGAPSIALLHRPLFAGTRPEELVDPGEPAPDRSALQSIWLSYWLAEARNRDPNNGEFVEHRLLAAPQADWEQLKIGCGTPPILCRHGWLILYHGVQERPDSAPEHRKFTYSAGVMILSREKPHEILYRSREPILKPEGDLEMHGAVDSVVFPTGIDRRDDLGTPDRFDVYYGMADDRIGVARLTVPETLD